MQQFNIIPIIKKINSRLIEMLSSIRKIYLTTVNQVSSTYSKLKI